MFLPRPDPVLQKAARGHVRAKARLLLKRGVHRFRSENRRQASPVELDPEVEAGVVRACEQLLAGRGFSMKKPLEGIGVAACYALLDTFHFQAVARRSASKDAGILDRLECQHQVQPEKVWVVYNLVAYEPTPAVS